MTRYLNMIIAMIMNQAPFVNKIKCVVLHRKVSLIYINGSGFLVAKHFYLSLFSKLAGGWLFPRHEDVKGPGFVLYWEFYVALTLFFSHIAIWNRRYPISEITAARPGNKPGPITPQAKSVTTSPSPLQQRD